MMPNHNTTVLIGGGGT